MVRSSGGPPLYRLLVLVVVCILLKVNAQESSCYAEWKKCVDGEIGHQSSPYLCDLIFLAFGECAKPLTCQDDLALQFSQLIGDYTCTNTDQESATPSPCAVGPCQNGAQCVVQNSNFTCLCPVGFNGKLCENRISNSCQSNPCMNGGLCREDSVNGYNCICQGGFTGLNCDQKPDLFENITRPMTTIPTAQYDSCQSNPCMNGGLCRQDSVNGYNCICQGGFTGLNCDQKPDLFENITRPMTTIPTTQYAGCTCVNGYCSANGYCVCYEGFTGQDCRVTTTTSPSRENSTSLDTCARLSMQCTNTRAAQYIADLEKNGQNISEHLGQICSMMNGTLECIKKLIENATDECRSTLEQSYKQNKNSIDMMCNHCYMNPCMNDGSCVDLITDYKCTCPSPYYGKMCEFNKNYDAPCGSTYCQHGGKCIGDNYCQCTPDYSGYFCENRLTTEALSTTPRPSWTSIPPNQCGNYTCFNGGRCDNNSCLCLFNFYGDQCQYSPYNSTTSRPVSMCNGGYCQNEASCWSADNGDYCNCLPGFTGKYCESRLGNSIIQCVDQVYKNINISQISNMTYFCSVQKQALSCYDGHLHNLTSNDKIGHLQLTNLTQVTCAKEPVSCVKTFVSCNRQTMEANMIKNNNPNSYDRMKVCSLYDESAKCMKTKGYNSTGCPAIIFQQIQSVMKGSETLGCTNNSTPIYGTTTSSSVQWCNGGYCSNGGRCIQGSYCSCSGPYTGRYCDSFMASTTSSSVQWCNGGYCSNGGRCIQGSYCSCSAPYTGRYCEDYDLQCQPGVEKVECFINPCIGHTCSGNSSAKCVMNNCGKCDYMFVDDKGQYISCPAVEAEDICLTKVTKCANNAMINHTANDLANPDMYCSINRQVLGCYENLTDSCPSLASSLNSTTQLMNTVCGPDGIPPCFRTLLECTNSSLTMIGSILQHPSTAPRTDTCSILSQTMTCIENYNRTECPTLLLEQINAMTVSYNSLCGAGESCNGYKCYNGTCNSNGNGESYCSCDAGFYGFECNMNVCDYFDGNPCGQGTCIGQIETGDLCSCPYYREGILCEINDYYESLKVCTKRKRLGKYILEILDGKQTAPPQLRVSVASIFQELNSTWFQIPECTSEGEYSGLMTEFNVYNTSQHNYYCVDKYGSRRIGSYMSSSPQNCSEFSSACQSSPCWNGGKCQDYYLGITNHFMCTCSPGYFGKQCESRFCNSFQRDPCSVNGGICLGDIDRGQLCSCPDGMMGPLCDQVGDDYNKTDCQRIYELTVEVEKYLNGSKTIPLLNARDMILSATNSINLTSMLLPICDRYGQPTNVECDVDVTDTTRKACYCLNQNGRRDSAPHYDGLPNCKRNHTGSCPPGVPVVNCFVDPCQVTSCPRYPYTSCRANYCGGCNAEFFINGTKVDCSKTKPDLSWDPPRIVSQSNGTVYFKIGEEVILYCMTTSHNFSHTWFKDGVKVDYRYPGHLNYNRVITRNGSLAIVNPNYSDEGIYQCQFGPVIGDFVTLREAKIGYSYNGHATRLVSLGESLKLDCKVGESSPPAQVLWMVERDFESPLEMNLTDRITMDYDGNLYFVNVRAEDTELGMKYACYGFNAPARMVNKFNSYYIDIEDTTAPMKKFENRLMWNSRSRQPALLGEEYKLKCIFSGYPSPFVSIRRMNESKRTDTSAESKYYQNELVIKNVTMADAGEYECYANTEGNVIQSSRIMFIEVQAKPYFLEPPRNQAMKPGDMAVFNCKAGGIPTPTVRWYINGTSLQSINNTMYEYGYFVTTEERNTVLRLRHMKAYENNLVIQCNVSNSHGYLWTNMALTLQVRNQNNSSCPPGVPVVMCAIDPCQVTSCPRYPYTFCRANYCGGCNAEFFINGTKVDCSETKPDLSWDPPRIVSQSNGTVYFKIGEEVILYCMTTSHNFSHTWFKDGVKVDYRYPGHLNYNRVITRNGSLAIVNPNYSDEGIYQCQFGPVIGDFVTLREAKIGYSYNGHATRLVSLGESLKLDCKVGESSPPAQVLWMVERDFESPLEMNLTDRITMDYEGNLYFVNVRAEDTELGMKYACYGFNAPARMVNKFNSYYIDIEDTTAPMKKFENRLMWNSRSRQPALLGEEYKLKCIFSGYPSPFVSIRRMNESKRTDTSAESKYYQNELVIKNVTMADAGEYECYANTEGNVIQSSRIMFIEVQAKPYFLEPPRNQDMKPGDMAVFKCKAGGIPTPTVRWYINGTSLQSINNTMYEYGYFVTTEERNTVLRLRHMKAYENNLVIQCNVSNSHGYLWTNMALTLQVRNQNNSSCPPGVPVVMCAIDPCQVTSCPRYPYTFCRANYCGGCNAEFFINGTKVDCSETKPVNVCDYFDGNPCGQGTCIGQIETGDLCSCPYYREGILCEINDYYESLKVCTKRKRLGKYILEILDGKQTAPPQLRVSVASIFQELNSTWFQIPECTSEGEYSGLMTEFNVYNTSQHNYYCVDKYGSRRIGSYMSSSPQNCSEFSSACQSSPCWNGGKCQDYYLGITNHFMCTCSPGYFGKQCESRFCNSFQRDPCSVNGGICLGDIDRGQLCSCPDGMMGPLCDQVGDDYNKTDCQRIYELTVEVEKYLNGSKTIPLLNARDMILSATNSINLTSMLLPICDRYGQPTNVECDVDVTDTTRKACYCLNQNGRRDSAPHYDGLPNCKRNHTGSCPPGVPVVNCFVDPCQVTSCPRYPYTSCRANYCGGCNAEFFINGTKVDCSKTKPDLSWDPPRIVSQSNGTVYFKIGEEVILNCTTTSHNFSHTWFKDGVKVDYGYPGHLNYNRVITRNGSLAIVNPNYSDEGIYQCQFGPVIGDFVTLREAKIGYSYNGHATRLVSLGESLKLDCKVGESSPPAQVLWMVERDFESPLEMNLTDRITMDYEGNLYFVNVRAEDTELGMKYACYGFNAPARMVNKFNSYYIDIEDTTAPMKKFENRLMWNSRSRQPALLGEEYKLKCIFSGYPSPFVSIRRMNESKRTDTSAESKYYQNELVIKNVTMADAGEYECYANTEGNVIQSSRIMFIEVQAKPYFLEPPRNQDMKPGDMAVFKCKAGGIPTPTVRWYINGTSLQSINNTMYEYGYFVTTEERNTVLRLRHMKVYENNLVIQCNVSNNHGYLWTNMALTLQVTNQTNTMRPGRCPPVRNDTMGIGIQECSVDTDCIKDSALKCCFNGFGHQCMMPVANRSLFRTSPVIIAQSPAMNYFISKKPSILYCQAEGNDLSYTWYKDGVEFNFTDPRYLYRVIHNNGTIRNSETLRSLDDGVYQCMVSNDNGTAIGRKIVLKEATFGNFNGIDRTQSVEIGTSLTLYCNMPYSVPKAKITWILMNSSVNRYAGQKNYSIVNLTNRINMDDQGNLLFVNVKASDAVDGKAYICMGVNPVSKTKRFTYYYTLNTVGDIAIRHAPAMQWTSPRESTGMRGNEFSLKCIFSGYPTPEVEFERIDFRPMSDYVQKKSFGLELYFPTLNMEDAGSYRCFAKDGRNRRKRATDIRTFNVSVESKPYFNVVPNTDVQVIEGANTVFSCRAEGVPQPKITWYINGKRILYASRFTVTGERNEMLLIENVTLSDRFVVQCNASNTHGSLLMNMYLHVKPQMAMRPGRCPPVRNDTMGIGIQECSVDTDCIKDSALKCCSNGFGNQCMMPVNVTQGNCYSMTGQCLNGGTCMMRNSSTLCWCPRRYTGNRCQTWRSLPCDSYPCQNGASCQDVNENSYSCSCPSSWGKNCESPTHDNCTCNYNESCVLKESCDIENGRYFDCKKTQQCWSNSMYNPCVATLCPMNSECYIDVNSIGRCSCRNGFSGSDCSVNDKVCEKFLNVSSCSMSGNGTCVGDLDNGIMCSCAAGKTGPFCDKASTGKVMSRCEKKKEFYDLLFSENSTRTHVIREMINSKWIPRVNCTPEGYFTPKQCYEQIHTKYPNSCKCVNSRGHVLSEMKTYPGHDTCTVPDSRVETARRICSTQMANDLCWNGGRCKGDILNGKICECRQGYSGLFCHKQGSEDVDEQSLCELNRQAFNLITQFTNSSGNFSDYMTRYHSVDETARRFLSILEVYLKDPMRAIFNDSFVPKANCTLNGEFAPVQCVYNVTDMSLDACYCAYRNGTVIPGTRVNSPAMPMCDKRENETSCHPLEDCDISCGYGYQHDMSGCPICACKSPCAGKVCGHGHTCQLREKLPCYNGSCVTAVCVPDNKDGKCPDDQYANITYVINRYLNNYDCTNECKDDSECTDDMVCCGQACGSKCIKPLGKGLCKKDLMKMKEKAKLYEAVEMVLSNQSAAQAFDPQMVEYMKMFVSNRVIWKPSCIDDNTYQREQCYYNHTGVNRPVYCQCMTSDGVVISKTKHKVDNSTITLFKCEGKPGICPRVENGTVGITVEMCSNDYDCNGLEKCCSNGGGHVCKQPVPKQQVNTGSCPRKPPRYNQTMICKDECKDDKDCSSGKKCCGTSCAKRCIVSEDIMMKESPCLPGVKPLQDWNCGRGASKCPNGYYCDIAPNDKYAACCPDEPEDVCSRPKDSGPCYAAFNHWYFNSQTKQCEQFIYGGCSGNNNNFQTKEECCNLCGHGGCKEGQCPTIEKSIYASCDVKCKSDSDCVGGSMCCSNGCGMHCVAPTRNANSTCFRELEKANLKMSNKLIGQCTPVMIPRCNIDGSWNPEQCMDNYGLCWCVMKNGTKIPGTTVSGRAQCRFLPKKDSVTNQTQPWTNQTRPRTNQTQSWTNQTQPNNTSSTSPPETVNMCPPGESVYCCSADLCKMSVCPSHPSAVCRVNPCGKCSVVFYDFDNSVVNCTQGLSMCEKRRHAAVKARYQHAFNNMSNIHPIVVVKNDSIKTDMEVTPDKTVMEGNDSVCSLPPVTGMCRAYFPRWYFNPATSLCQKFIYGGCGGNDNNFDRPEECYARCSPKDSPCMNMPCSDSEVCMIETDPDCYKGACRQAPQCIKQHTNPHITGVYVPECTDNDYYEYKQCHHGYCWCVTGDGEVFTRSLTRGPLTCSETGPVADANFEPEVCTDGSSINMKCLDVCQDKLCPDHPEAMCSVDLCSTDCKVKFINKTNQEVACGSDNCKVVSDKPNKDCAAPVVCPGQVAPKLCPLDICEKASCYGNPCALCSVDPCTCKPVFVDIISNTTITDCSIITHTMCRMNYCNQMKDINRAKSMGQDSDMVLPGCDETGRYNSTQCDSDTCWCVDGKGQWTKNLESAQDTCSRNETLEVTVQMKFDHDFSKVENNLGEFEQAVLELMKKWNIREYVKSVTIRAGSVIVETTFGSEENEAPAPILSIIPDMIQNRVQQNDAVLNWKGEEWKAESDYFVVASKYEKQDSNGGETTQAPIPGHTASGMDEKLIIVISVICGALAASIIAIVVWACCCHKPIKKDNHFTDIDSDTRSPQPPFGVSNQTYLTNQMLTSDQIIEGKPTLHTFGNHNKTVEVEDYENEEIKVKM